MCDRDDGIRAAIRGLYPSVAVVPDLQVIFDDSAVSAVVVATHAPSHFEVAEAALRAGRDVFVEKPMALTAAEGARVVETAEAHGRVLMVGHVLVYHAAVRELNRLAHAGEST